jgi:uracil-DNA glycosylase family protein
MHSIVLDTETDFPGWRRAARALALEGVAPEDAVWSVTEAADLFAAPAPEAAPPAGTFSVPRALVDLAETAIQARDAERFALLYRLVWRAHHGEKHLLEDAADPQVQRVQRLAQAVRRDTHKMRAFVRFREVRDTGGLGASPAPSDDTPDDAQDEGVRDASGPPPAAGPERPGLHEASRAAPSPGPRTAPAVGPGSADLLAAIAARPAGEFAPARYVAWFEPDHFIVEANAPFFVRRFATMQWSILTPDRCAHWDGEALTFTPGADRSQLPDDDALAEYWRAYFSSIFNPARLKVGAMTSEMPRKYWKNLPEAAAIPGLIRDAQSRTEQMVERPTISPPRERKMPKVPAAPADALPATAAHLSGDLVALAAEAAACRRCPLWEPATQTVFGEGPADARLMFVGEQPGDQEDLAGRPFIGPAGQLFDRALAEAGIDRSTVYVTNSVKHFKFEPRGKRRIHVKPGATEINACNVWLQAERAAIKPALTVALGATAARAVLGRTVTIGRERSRPIALDGNAQAFVTVHPSYLLRLPDEDAKAREYAAFVEDLRHAASLLA